jgi:hypothetical protein
VSRLGDEVEDDAVIVAVEMQEWSNVNSYETKGGSC